MMNIVKPENLKITFFDDDEYSDLIKQVKGTKVEYLSLSRCQERNIHYTV